MVPGTATVSADLQVRRRRGWIVGDHPHDDAVQRRVRHLARGSTSPTSPSPARRPSAATTPPSTSTGQSARQSPRSLLTRFSVQWARIQTFVAGTYTFTLGTDDGGRLLIDGALVLDRWVCGLPGHPARGDDDPDRRPAHDRRRVLREQRLRPGRRSSSGRRPDGPGPRPWWRPSGADRRVSPRSRRHGGPGSARRPPRRSPPKRCGLNPRLVLDELGGERHRIFEARGRGCTPSWAASNTTAWSTTADASTAWLSAGPWGTAIHWTPARGSPWSSGKIQRLPASETASIVALPTARW